MIRNYIVIATRNLLNGRLFSAINIVGLSIGIGCCLVLGLFVIDQYSYDRYHEHARQIYRVVNRQAEGSDYSYNATTQGILGPELQRNFGEVKKACRVELTYQELSTGGKKPEKKKVMFVDPSYFQMFSLPMRSAQGKTISPDGIFISASAAVALFGVADPLGQTISVKDLADFKVTGVYQDFPSNSHIAADYIISFLWLEKTNPEQILSWNFNMIYTYVQMPDGFDHTAFDQKLDTFIHRFTPESWKSFTYHLQPLLEIHLDNRYRASNASPSVGGMLTRVIAAVGLAILLLACLNYMNMATARSVKRSLEVGVRKVMGAHRRQLIGQFLAESFMVCTISFALGILWADLGVPAFNAFTGWKLDLNNFLTDYRFVTGLIACNFLLAIVAGSYPAFFLSRFLPVSVLKGQRGIDTSRRLRKGLVLVQFSLTTVLVVMVVVVFRQFDYLRSKDLGFNKEQLLLFEASVGDNMSPSSFKHELYKNPGVKQVCSASSVPGTNVNSTGITPVNGEQNNIKIDWIFADEDYIPTLELKLLAGRNFNANGYDENSGVIINEEAARVLGWSAQEAVGKKITGFIFRDSLPGEIIGVIGNYHVSSLRRQINPMVIGYSADNGAYIARLSGSNLFATRDQVDKTLRTLQPDVVPEIVFMDDFIEMNYAGEKKMGQFLGFFTLLAIVVGCSGLFALSAYEGEQRVKELGIRKILGASSFELMLMLSRDFLKLVTVALVVAMPAAYYFSDMWLRPFPYRISWSVQIFAEAALAVLLLAWITIATQTVRSSRLNPADALRHE